MNIAPAPLQSSLIAFSGFVSTIWGMWFQTIVDRINGLFTNSNELKIKLYSQDAEPTLTEINSLALWKDTNDSNKIYLVFKRANSDQVKVELT